MGKYYNCREQSQNEFVYHFNLPSTDPRHPAQGVNQQKGIYSAYMFKKPGQVANGVHLINLDARYDRSPTYSTYGPCEGGSSRMLSETQWTWLQNEFHRVSEIKVIGSGVQVLPPTNPGTTSFCAYDGPTGSFNANNTAVGEGPGTPAAGTVYESWAEIPQERTRLLQMAQRSINDGNAKHVIFISGDQHWAEIMAKKMPGSPSGGAPQTLYEVTASGIDQNWPYTVANTNRVRVRTADFQGDGKFVNECNFPFVYGGVTYNDCTNVGHTALWCSTQTTTGNAHVAGQWGNCLPEADELVPRASISFSNENTCTDNYLHVCSARANYGGIKVDWSANTVKLSIFTPHQTNVEAASVTLSF
jgi:alkaline phosphatase D